MKKFNITETGKDNYKFNIQVLTSVDGNKYFYAGVGAFVNSIEEVIEFMIKNEANEISDKYSKTTDLKMLEMLKDVVSYFDDESQLHGYQQELIEKISHFISVQ